MKQLFFALAIASAGYGADTPPPGWKHTGTMTVITTPDGADMAAGVFVENFPLLVRLHRDWFDFKQPKVGGEDVRFTSSTGAALAYQIEEWDAAGGTASIWVRVPRIDGQARQAIRMHWGNANATSESNAKAVFNEANGYLTVLHMGDGVADEVGSVQTKDIGTTATAGIIGPARHLGGKQGVSCGEEIENFPVGSSPHSTEAWLRAEKSNGRIVGWGNEQGQGKVVMEFQSPPHIRMDCYFSGANISSEGRLPMNEWVHVVHTYVKGDSRIYVNGELNHSTKTKDGPLAIKTPARLYIGGWYNNYDFIGDLDEVRISKVTHSPEWVKLQYENQKAQQTLVGPLVQPGNVFAVSSEKAVVEEGESVAFTAQAGGAQKVCWLLKRDGREEVVATDRFRFTFAAGRVTGDTLVTLQFTAVFPDGVKTRDIPITIAERIPEPHVKVRAPAGWNGRDTIEVQASTWFGRMPIEGMPPMNITWKTAGGAVLKDVDGQTLRLKRSQFTGELAITATVSNGGAEAQDTATLVVTEPKRDAWVTRAPAKDERPEEGQFYARDDKNEGTLHYNGTLSEHADVVFLKLFANEKLVKTETTKPDADKSFAFAVKLKPGLIKYRVEFGRKTGGTETVLRRVGDLVCGDVFLIDGQSNALATDTSEKSPPETSEWIRSYGGPTGRADGVAWLRDRQKAAEGAGLALPNLWCRPVWKRSAPEHQAELGWWGMALAKRLVASNKMPVCIIQAAIGGSRIDEHQASPADHGDLSTMYGRMLWRVQQARLTHGIRGILWHQGENDQGANGPTGGFGWETYQSFFVEMAGAWKQDFPNVQHYYVFQIWPNSCSMGGREGSGDRLREKQRTLPQLFSNMSILSTLGVRPPGGCHYPLEGWAEVARMVQPLIERDVYGRDPGVPITAANLKSVSFANTTKDTLILEFDQPVIWLEALTSQFYLDGEPELITSGSAKGNTLTLKLKSPSNAKTITYLQEKKWSQDTLLKGENGLAALTFCEVPIALSR